MSSHNQPIRANMQDNRTPNTTQVNTDSSSQPGQPQAELHTLDDYDDEYDEEEEEEEDEEADYYDPQEDLERHYEQNLLIEQSWIDWERQSTVNNIQSLHRQPYSPRQQQYRYNIFQKPGSAKRRDRRERWALDHYNAQMASAASASNSSRSAAAVAAEAGSSIMDHGSPSASEKLRRLGTYRPALASSIVHSYTNSQSWEAAQAAREQRLAAKSVSGTG
jgi:hypothetical protein